MSWWHICANSRTVEVILAAPSIRTLHSFRISLKHSSLSRKQCYSSRCLRPNSQRRAHEAVARWKPSRVLFRLRTSKKLLDEFMRFGSRLATKKRSRLCRRWLFTTITDTTQASEVCRAFTDTNSENRQDLPERDAGKSLLRSNGPGLSDSPRDVRSPIRRLVDAGQLSTNT